MTASRVPSGDQAAWWAFATSLRGRSPREPAVHKPASVWVQAVQHLRMNEMRSPRGDHAGEETNCPRRAGLLVAYFSMEFGLHERLPIYSGGLGILAGDHLKAAAELGGRLVGVGLLYRGRYFRQEIRRGTADRGLRVDPNAVGLVREPVTVTVELADETIEAAHGRPRRGLHDAERRLERRTGRAARPGHRPVRGHCAGDDSGGSSGSGSGSDSGTAPVDPSSLL